MGQMQVKGGVRKATISAVVTRKNGKVENLGVLAAYHRNPIINFLWALRRWAHGLARH
jgi:2-keto-4-pentenoate hydratase